MANGNGTTLKWIMSLISGLVLIVATVLFTASGKTNDRQDSAIEENTKRITSLEKSDAARTERDKAFKEQMDRMEQKLDKALERQH